MFGRLRIRFSRYDWRLDHTPKRIYIIRKKGYQLKKSSTIRRLGRSGSIFQMSDITFSLHECAGFQCLDRQCKKAFFMVGEPSPLQVKTAISYYKPDQRRPGNEAKWIPQCRLQPSYRYYWATVKQDTHIAITAFEEGPLVWFPDLSAGKAAWAQVREVSGAEINWY